MPVDSLKTLEIIEVMENFLARSRPPVNIRHQLDIGYKIEDQSVYIVEIRPQWDNPSVIQEHAIAKTTFIKAKNHWTVFWLRQDLKWHPYSPTPTVQTLNAFVKLVDEDKHHCFWG